MDFPFADYCNNRYLGEDAGIYVVSDNRSVLVPFFKPNLSGGLNAATIAN